VDRIPYRDLDEDRDGNPDRRGVRVERIQGGGKAAHNQFLDNVASIAVLRGDRADHAFIPFEQLGARLGRLLVVGGHRQPDHDVVLDVADNALAVNIYEHSETWTWQTGETALLPFVTVHKVADGRVTLWKDYWDLSGLTAQAPPDWMTQLQAADTSWVFDATGVL
jgi:hypothetical protein